MPDGSPFEADKPGPEATQTQWQGDRTASPDPVAAIHEDATILGGLDVQRPGSPSTDDRATGVADLAEFHRAVIDIGLIDETELETLASTIPGAEGVLGLARVLQQAGRLTRYQAAALYQRKSRGLLIGNYLILDKLGQGGMGVVFKARHRRLGRVVALKILPPSFARDKTAVDRFKREVEAAGRLKHPNVVAALDADEDRGVHFLVMEYVEGSDLDDVVRHRGQLPLGQAVDFVIQAARGLEAAHSQGIVHRDIKPSNLMLDGAGTVRVLDLGLARIVDASNPFGQAAGARLTQSGTYMGTVDYMAPEQAEDSRKADHRADIYSLGCTLYFLLTGREPFVGDTILKRLMAHMERPAPMLRALRPDAPTGLEQVYQKMMAKRPADRPESMSEVIRLLELCEDAVDEAPPPRVEAPKSSPRLMVFDEGGPRKGGAPAKGGGDASVFALGDDAGSPIGPELALEDLAMDVRSEAIPPPLPAPTIRRGVRPRTGEPRRAETARPTFSRRAQTISIVAALAAFAVGAVGVRLAFFPGRSDSESAGKGTISGLEGAVDDGLGKEEDHPPPKPEWVSRTIFDGKSPKGWMLTNGLPLDPKHVQRDGLNPHGTGSYMVVYRDKVEDFVLDFDYKLTEGCNSGVLLRVSNLNDPPHTGPEVELVASPERALRESGAICDLVPAASHAQRPTGEWNHMTIAARGPMIEVNLNGTEVSRINLDEWKVPGKRPDGTDHKFKNVAFVRLPRKGYLGFQDLKGDCWFREIVLKTPAGSPSTRAIAGSNQASGASPALADPEPLVEFGQITGHDNGFLEQVHLLRDGKTLLTTCMDGKARLWDLASGRLIRMLWHPAALRPAAVHPDGRHVVTGCSDGYVRLWDLQTGREERRLTKHQGRVWGVAISPDGQSVLSAGDDGIVRVSDIQRGWETKRFKKHDSSDWSAAFSPDGRRVLAGGDDGVVRLGDLSWNDQLVPLTGQSSFAYSVAFAPDGRHAASSGRGQLTYWDLDTKRGVKIPLDAEAGSSLAFAPDGRRIYYCTHHKASDGGVFDDGLIGYWDTDGRNPPRILRRGHGRLGLALLPDGGLVTAELGGIARIWRPSRSLERARQFDVDGKHDGALAEYTKLLADRPDDARLLIERGRLLYELGRPSEASADYARTAKLAPDNPQVFLETAGWWVAGPYPPDLSVPTSFQIDKAIDPSKPAPPAGNQARRWQRAPIEMQGRLDFQKVYKADNTAAYAMAIFHCPIRHEVVMLWGYDDQATVYLNGKEIARGEHGPVPFGRWWSLVTAEAGRNTLLAKVVNATGDHSLNLVISEAPADFARTRVHFKRWGEAIEDYKQALIRDPSTLDAALFWNGGTALAEVGRHKDALAAWKRLCELDPEVTGNRERLAAAYLVLDEGESLRRMAVEMLRTDRLNKDPRRAIETTWIAALLPDVLERVQQFPAEMGRYVGRGQVDADGLRALGAGSYRLARKRKEPNTFSAAAGFLRRAIQARKGKDSALDWVFLALTLHHLKDPGAGGALAKARALAEDHTLEWYQRVEIAHLLKEAEAELKVPVR